MATQQSHHIRSHHPQDQSNAVEPGKLYIMQRDNKSLVAFNPDKIKIAITKAYLAVEGDNASAFARVHEVVEALTAKISYTVLRHAQIGNVPQVEYIQDQVEAALMAAGLHQVARSYILYREERRLARLSAQKSQPQNPLYVTLANNQKVALDEVKLQHIIKQACDGLAYVEADAILEETKRNIFDGIHITDVHKAMVMSARAKIEAEPNYSYVAARLLLQDLHQEALAFLALPLYDDVTQKKALYPQIFNQFIHKGIELELLSPTLLEFDLERLGQVLNIKRDEKFTYLGLQTLYDRYFLHSNQIRFELPQMFFMRVAMGLAFNETNRNERAIEFYDLLSSFDYMSSTPTLFNSATLRSQLSSCYLSTIPDDLAGIFDALKDDALLSKFAGGLGNDWTNVRAMGAKIKGTNGLSQGVPPFLKVANDTAVAVNQGGKRKGAMCAYLETWHLDIEDFLDLRKNTGDERRRTHDMNTANWIPDLFMKRVIEKQDWTLFSPNDVPDLHDLYGAAFEQAYLAYEEKAARNEIRLYKKIPALSLWRKMLSMVFETGHPWITFKDPCNLRSPQQHAGVIHSSNLCTEITLNTSFDEIAVCNLGSINLAQHISEGQLDRVKLQKTIRTAVRMLDNVIDINYYPVIQAERSNLRHRPIGLGLMGFQDALYQLDIAYASQAAIDFADYSMEVISYYAIEASNELARERGSYQSFAGSLWSQGILPIDSIEKLADYRGEYLELDRNSHSDLDWEDLRQRVKTSGMRNSNVMAIAPTATIANITGVTQSIEPTFQNLYAKANLSGEFTVINPYLVRDLKALGLWDEVLVNDLKYYNGSVQQIGRIPEHLKTKYSTAFEMEPHWLIEAGARRQKWIDQSQSLNVYLAKPSGKAMDTIYMLAWRRGLKTTYYMRALGASDAEKSTLNRSQLNAVEIEAPVKMCPITDPTCEACE